MTHFFAQKIMHTTENQEYRGLRLRKWKSRRKIRWSGRTRGERRKSDFKKAARKRAIHRELTSDDGVLMYSNLHQYSKNKIHCSCCLCRGKDRFGRHILSEQEIRNYGKYEEELAYLYSGEEVLAWSIDNSWRALLGDDRKVVGDFACFLMYAIGISSR